MNVLLWLQYGCFKIIIIIKIREIEVVPNMKIWIMYLQHVDKCGQNSKWRRRCATRDMRDRQTVRLFIDTRSIRENVHTVERGDEDDGDDEKSLSNRKAFYFAVVTTTTRRKTLSGQITDMMTATRRNWERIRRWILSRINPGHLRRWRPRSEHSSLQSDRAAIPRHDSRADALPGRRGRWGTRNCRRPCRVPPSARRCDPDPSRVSWIRGGRAERRARRARSAAEPHPPNIVRAGEFRRRRYAADVWPMFVPPYHTG